MEHGSDPLTINGRPPLLWQFGKRNGKLEIATDTQTLTHMQTRDILVNIVITLGYTLEGGYYKDHQGQQYVTKLQHAMQYGIYLSQS